MACSGDISWEGLKLSSPYPLTHPFDANWKAALKASDTIYCYDIPTLFESAVEKQWSDAFNNVSVERSVQAAFRPFMVMYTTEFVLQTKNGVGSSECWTMQDYLNGNLEMVQMQRGAVDNDVGMVA